MTAIVALAGAGAGGNVALLESLVARSRLRGSGPPSTWRDDDCTLVVLHHQWQAELGAVPIASVGEWVVAADATLFYRQDLERALPEALRETARCSTAASIAAVLDAWGPDALGRLEGDFAFVAWNRRERRLVAARDFAGTRPLFHTPFGGGVAVASSLTALMAVPGAGDALNLSALIEEAACLDMNCLEDTSMRRIRRLPAGFVLGYQDGKGATVRRFWEAPIFERGQSTSFDAGAEELRELLARAVSERLDDGGRPTSIWLSGGYDSTALFGAGSLALSRAGQEGTLKPVSYSHPIGDQGREDELIQATTARWGAVPHWLDISTVPPFDDPMASARNRDEPFSHPYERWNRWLAEGSRTVGARVALSGNGGDQFFSVTPIFFADLVRAGRLGAVRREWKERFGTFRFRSFFRLAIQPNLPPSALAVAQLARGGRPLQHYFHRRIAPWFRRDALVRHQIAERAADRPPRRSGESHSAWEHAWFLRSGFGERVNSLASAFALDEGVEVRIPLYDERVIRFAATRPRWESNSGGENKRLLRGSMRGLLPEEVIGRRMRRTGVPSTYFARAATELLASSLQWLSSELVIADLDIVDPDLLRSAIESFLAGRLGDAEVISAIMYTIQSELWLRAYYKSGGSSVGAVPDSNIRLA